MYRVVVVDDEVAIANLVGNHVNQMDGFRVADVFYDGVSAKEYLGQNHVDILITDIRMPDVSGLDLAEYVSEYVPGCAVVLVSAYSEFEYAKRAISLGVVDYLLKPLQFKALDDQLLRIAQRIEAFRAEILGSASAREEAIDMLIGDLVEGRISNEQQMQERLNGSEEGKLLRTGCSVLQIRLGNGGEYADRLSGVLRRVLLRSIPDAHACSIRNSEEQESGYYLLTGCRMLTEGQLSGLRFALEQALRVEAVITVELVCSEPSELLRWPGLKTLRTKQADSNEWERDFMQLLKAYIREHISESLTRDEMAAAVYMSPYHFSRCVKSVCGCGYHEFVSRQRIQRAMELLRSSMQIQDISGAVGYKDDRYFRKVFQQHTGMSPSEYRRSVSEQALIRENDNE